MMLLLMSFTIFDIIFCDPSHGGCRHHRQYQKKTHIRTQTHILCIKRQISSAHTQQWLARPGDGDRMNTRIVEMNYDAYFNN